MPKLSKRQKYDYREIDRRELKLIRVGHAIWTLCRRECAKKGSTGVEESVLLKACETVWQVKKALRLELKAERAASFKAWRGST